MPKNLPQEEYSATIKFGGGVHSRASEDEIDIRECAEGKNFDLDLQNREYKNRKPFDLIGTVPNGAEIRGFVNLIKTDGTVSVLVQAGATVYEWDGLTNFTSVGTVDSTSQLRGRMEHNWQLTDEVLITDLNLADVVMKWDGTTLADVVFSSDDGSTAFGTFKAKYLNVDNERAIFSNIHDNGTNFPHLIVGSKRADYTAISVSQRPASSLSAEDAWFMVQPDNRAINGMVNAFGNIVTSSFKGPMYTITGSDATDFSISPLYSRSGASGNESVAYIGNDIVYGRQGIIESLISTDKFGDVETDDLSKDISDSIETFKDWVIVYNQREQRVYCYPADQSQIWVLHKSLIGGELSPWSKWTTAHSMALNPTAMMNMLDPSDGLEYVYFGDSSGNFYRMEGSGTTGDGGLNNVTTERLSKLISAPLDSEIYNIQGWIRYRKEEAATVTLKFEYAGTAVFNETITITLPAITNRTTYGGGFYYADGEYYGTAFSGRLTRQKFAAPGKSTEFQVRITIEGTTDFQISEIGLRFQASS